jgi:hypothetical protein
MDLALSKLREHPVRLPQAKDPGRRRSGILSLFFIAASFQG